MQYLLPIQPCTRVHRPEARRSQHQRHSWKRFQLAFIHQRKFIYIRQTRAGSKSIEDGIARIIAFAIFRHTISAQLRSEEYTSELQSLMRISYAVFCLTKKTNKKR